MDKASLIAKNKDLTSELNQANSELNQAKLLLDQKELIIAKLRKMLFGPKSERYTSSQTQAIQASLFAELESINSKKNNWLLNKQKRLLTSVK